MSCGGPLLCSQHAVCTGFLQTGVEWAQSCPGILHAEGAQGRAAAYGAAQMRGGHPASEPRSGPVGGVDRSAPRLCAPAADSPMLSSLHAIPSARGSVPAPACPSVGPLLSPFAPHLWWVELYTPPNNMLEFNPSPGTCTWDLTRTEGLGRGNQVTMRSNWIMVALNPMTGGLVRGTFRHRHSGDDGAVSRQAETGVLSGHKPRHVEGGQQPSAAGRHREGRPLASTLTFDFRPPDREPVLGSAPRFVAMCHSCLLWVPPPRPGTGTTPATECGLAWTAEAGREGVGLAGSVTSGHPSGLLFQG